jgi:hypothetical protein
VKKHHLATSLGAFVLMAAGTLRSETHDDLALCQEMTRTKASLAEGIRQASKSETPISAKFEFDEHGKISLSVYTAAKGLIEAESNVLKEWAGSPEGGQWRPKAETFKDVEHVARASEQLTLLSLTSKSLIEILGKAEQEQQLGSVYSITPLVRDKRPMFDVLFLQKGKVTEVKYDLFTGNKI